MGRIQSYLADIAQSRLLAPNLKEMTLRVYTGNQHKGNAVARCGRVAAAAPARRAAGGAPAATIT